MKFDASAAWADAKRMLGGQREILLALTGFFIFLPNLMLATLRPFQADGTTIAEFFASWQLWMDRNAIWVVLSLIMAAIGRMATLILLTADERPTVGQSLRLSAMIVPIDVAAQLLSLIPIALGGLLLVVPALYVAARLVLVDVAIVAMRLRNPVAPLVTSWQVTRGNGWRLALVLVVLFLGGNILQIAAGTIGRLIFTLLGGAATGEFAATLIGAAVSAGMSLLLLLMALSAWRQLAPSR